MQSSDKKKKLANYETNILEPHILQAFDDLGFNKCGMPLHGVIQNEWGIVNKSVLHKK